MAIRGDQTEEASRERLLDRLCVDRRDVLLELAVVRLQPHAAVGHHGRVVRRPPPCLDHGGEERAATSESRSTLSRGQASEDANQRAEQRAGERGRAQLSALWSPRVSPLLGLQLHGPGLRLLEVEDDVVNLVAVRVFGDTAYLDGVFMLGRNFGNGIL